jgi:hypothetical protein
MDELAHDLAVLDSCISAVTSVWRAAPIPDVDSPSVLDRKAELKPPYVIVAVAIPC